MTAPSTDRDRIVRAAWELLELARKGTPLRNTDGEPVLVNGEPVYVPDLTACNRALETLARLGGFLIERIELTVKAPDGMPDDIGDGVLTDLLRARIAGSG